MATPDTIAPESRQRPAIATPRLATKAEKIVAFRRAIASGCNQVEASKAAGVSTRTASRWMADMQGGALTMKDAVAVIASKAEAASILSTIARNENESSAYRVSALATLNKQMGYDEPTRSQNVNLNVSVSDSTRDLIKSRTSARLAAMATQHQLAATSESRQLAGGDPPIEAAAEALSPSPTFPQNPANESEAK